MSTDLFASRLDQPCTSHLEQLTRHVQASLHGRVSDLCVQFGNQCVVLTGWTPTYHAKQLATEFAMRLTDLPVANEIQVVSLRAEGTGLKSTNDVTVLKWRTT